MSDNVRDFLFPFVIIALAVSLFRALLTKVGILPDDDAPEKKRKGSPDEVD